ncbi:MAG: LytTR family transcriptional regulator [Olsenella sp.]|nr:LytTR family transcriptional regulator [Olsenella sp.]
MAVHSVLDLSTLVLVSCAQGIPEQCARFLSESLTFVGPFGITTVAGAHAFMEYFAKMAPLFTKLDLTFGCPTIVFQSNENSVVFIGSCSGGRRPVVSLRATLVWYTGVPERPQLVHLHISIPPVEKRRDAPAPIVTSPDMPDTKGYEQDSLLYVHDTEGVSHAVHPSAIVYLAAAHQYVDIHLLRETFRTRCSLSSMLERLPATFVRVHRSYAVNARFVTSMSTTKVLLSNGEQVIVPAKRRTAVRKQLREALELNSYDKGPSPNC